MPSPRVSLRIVHSQPAPTAQQLGKGEQFRAFWTSGPKAPDEKDWLALFEGNRPVLILLDEMPPYFRCLDTQKVGNGTVADIATRAFANLLAAAGKKKDVCVVVSDLAAAYDTGASSSTAHYRMARAELGRHERSAGQRPIARSKPPFGSSQAVNVEPDIRFFCFPCAAIPATALSP